MADKKTEVLQRRLQRRLKKQQQQHDHLEYLIQIKTTELEEIEQAAPNAQKIRLLMFELDTLKRRNRT